MSGPSRVQQLFEAALDRDEDTRALWVREQCGDDSTLADAVLALLDADAMDGAIWCATSAQTCEATEVERLVPTRGSYNPLVVSGSNLPRAVQTGDFDGDGLADLALVQRAEDGDVRATVFYGDVKEALEDMVRTGSFGSIDALVPARSRIGATPNEELVQELAILSEGGQQWTPVTGSPGRSLLSPMPVPTDVGPSVGAGRVSVIAGPLLPREIGSEDDDERPNDLIALAPGHVWLFRDENVHHDGDAPVHFTPGELPDSLASFRDECAIWTHDIDETGGGVTLAGSKARRRTSWTDELRASSSCKSRERATSRPST